MGVQLPISSAFQWFTAKPPEMQPQDKLITVDTYSSLRRGESVDLRVVSLSKTNYNKPLK